MWFLSIEKYEIICSFLTKFGIFFLLHEREDNMQILGIFLGGGIGSVLSI